MPDKDDVGADIGEHFCGHFAGICAITGEAADILGASKDTVIKDNLHGVVQLQQVNGRRCESDQDAFGGGHDAEAVHECIVVLESAVHFPVADDPFLIPHSDFVIHLVCSLLFDRVYAKLTCSLVDMRWLSNNGSGYE